MFRAYEKPVTTISTTDCEDSSPRHVVSTSSSDQQQQHLEMGDHVGYLSRVVRKPAFCICENKDADQLRGNREAEQRLCFRYTDSTIPLLCGCTVRLVPDLVGNPKDRFSQNEANLSFLARKSLFKVFK